MSSAETATGNAWPASSRRPASERCCHAPTDQPAFFGYKAGLDRFLGAVLLALAAPVIGLLIAVIRLMSPGPGLYRQKRVGRGGVVFTMYKLRTMRCDAEAGTGPVWAGAGKDSRVTPLGVWLRRLHLDELPQLYNVMCGEMSLVGPRPERPEFVTVLASQIPDYLERLRVLPGITGLAQVNLPPDTDLTSVRRKLVLDREYIETAGFLMELRIVLCTLLRVVGIRGGRAVWLMGLFREVSLRAEACGPATPVNLPVAVTDVAAATAMDASAATFDDANSDEAAANPQSETAIEALIPSGRLAIDDSGIELSHPALVAGQGS